MPRNRKQTDTAAIYAEVTAKIIEALDAGIVPWQKGWNTLGAPTNHAKGNRYRGINVFTLSVTAFLNDYSTNRWVTFKQAKELGGSIRKGEKSSIVTFWKRIRVDDEANPGEKKTIPLLRYYRVFNLDQTDGIDYDPEVIRRDDAGERVEADDVFEGYVARSGVGCELDDSPMARAYYDLRADRIVVPAPALFGDDDSFHETRFHEAIHSTGHADRLARDGIVEHDRFGSPIYSFEELVAELGSSMLCAVTGVDPDLPNQASYIAGWLRVFRAEDGDKVLVRAAGKAQRAADLVLGVTWAEDAGQDSAS